MPPNHPIARTLPALAVGAVISAAGCAAAPPVTEPTLVPMPATQEATRDARSTEDESWCLDYSQRLGDLNRERWDQVLAAAQDGLEDSGDVLDELTAFAIVTGDLYADERVVRDVGDCDLPHLDVLADIDQVIDDVFAGETTTSAAVEQIQPLIDSLPTAG